MENLFSFLSLRKIYFMIRKIFLSLVIAIPVTIFAQAPKKLPLDGQKFTAEIKQEGKKKPWDPDEVNFNSGKFKCPIFSDEGWGFVKAGKYQITKDSTTADGIKIYSWVGDLVNDKEETLSWAGTITGEDIEGTIELVNKKGKTEGNYVFSGKLKKKAGLKQ